MLQTVPDILAKIVAHKRQELAERGPALRLLESQAAATIAEPARFSPFDRSD